MRKKTLLLAAVFVLIAAPLVTSVSAQIYYFNMRGGDNTIYETDEVDFVGNSTAITTTPTADPTFAMDANADGSFIYAVQWTGGAGIPNIWRWAPGDATVDETFGALTGPPDGVNISGMSYNAANDTWYLIAIETGGVVLYSGDITTGSFSSVGTLTAGSGFMIDISINAAGECYGHDLGDDMLYSIDLTDGTTTAIGPTNQPANFAQGMDFCPDSGVLYATVYTGGGTGQFGSFNLATGNLDVIQETTPLDAEMEMVCLGSSSGGDPICASDGTLVEGFGEINDFMATCGSDDVYWEAHGASLFFQLTDPVVQFDLTASAPTDGGGGFSDIKVCIEASKHADTGTLVLRAFLYDFVADDCVALDPGTFVLQTVDQLTEYCLPDGANPDDFIDPNTGEVLLCIDIIQTGGLANTRTRLDHIEFKFVE